MSLYPYVDNFSVVYLFQVSTVLSYIARPHRSVSQDNGLRVQTKIMQSSTSGTSSAA